MIARLAFKNLLHRPFATALSWVLLTVGVAIISLLMLLQKQLEEQLTANSRQVDMVIGAKGSPLQLVLSAVYHVDNPTGNISYAEAEKWMQHPFVQTAVPLSYGDSYRGYSIVGTTPLFFTQYTAGLATGSIFRNDFDVVIGSSIAEKLRLKIGDEFFGTHGDANGEVHKEHAYKVVGILKPGNASSNHLILCTMQSVWRMHEEHHDDKEIHHEEEGNHHEDDHDKGKDNLQDGNHHKEDSDKHGEISSDHLNKHEKGTEEEDAQITAVLIKFRNPLGLVQLPRTINQNTNLMAATPAIEINRIFTLFGAGLELLRGIGWGIVILSAFSVFAALYSSLESRRYELALLRSLGAGKGKLAWLLILESLILCAVAFVTGIVVSRIALLSVAKSVEQDYHVNVDNLSFQWPEEEWLLGATLLIGLLAAVLPAAKAASVNISKTLSND